MSQWRHGAAQLLPLALCLLTACDGRVHGGVTTIDRSDGGAREDGGDARDAARTGEPTDYGNIGHPCMTDHDCADPGATLICVGGYCRDASTMGFPTVPVAPISMTFPTT